MTLPRFAQSLGGCSLASLSRFPFNGSIKLLQNLHSRGSMKQHFYIWEPHCGYLHKVKIANEAINMHSRVAINMHSNVAISPKSSEKCTGTPMFYTTTELLDI